MNFKDLENVESGVMLVNSEGNEREFIAYHPERRRVITFAATTFRNNNAVTTWDEEQIEFWTIKKPERKKIELCEYVTDYGYPQFLTEDEKRISFKRIDNNNLVTASFVEKCHKIPNGRKVYAYADTLEYCEGP